LEIGSGVAKATNTVTTAVRREGQVARNVLKDEFQFLQKSEETKRQEALWREQEQGKFVIEWTEDEPEEVPVPTRRNRRIISKDTVKIGVVFEDD